MVSNDLSDAQKLALELIAQNGQGVAKRLAERLGISRQASNRQLRKLVDLGLVSTSGNTKARTHSLVALNVTSESYPIEGLMEDRVWKEACSPFLNGLPENTKDIWHYGITEMVNNAIDHSGGAGVEVALMQNAHHCFGMITDDGMGIFRKIQNELNLYDPREAILELAKGKLTTDPERHSGEGVFFTSRLFDEFTLASSGLVFLHRAREGYALLEGEPPHAAGTTVMLQLANHSNRNMQDVFDRFAAPEEYSFVETLVPVRLAQYEGEKLISRSQAKRLYYRFERFRNVILDFEGVAEIGQAFADELFRVFPNIHPEVELTPIKTTAAVQRMVTRALALGKSQKEDKQ
jgi:anti-sigma regulatory factor (Ser/Thr protein kinase)/biotin operon repressor